ncbi:putative DNA-binding transcriptional regulator YafY [Caulobacter ginsengisoli]|uniref:DNA-binding transcriptional regulator YafY n=1 Tax=Caulobacter ginsengisoli TaxID=400775 RepID=A0ABU0ISM2_9CAUL|nr:putative DNA-binding transcriptional regulator YafY [Caulobacter ginsengisoli]
MTAQVLAEELGVSVRTVYRDIATLAAEGAAIQGEAGLGYVMQPGLFLPPLGFERDELEALALGLAWVQGRADPVLGRAADNALAKIHAMLPPEGRETVEGEEALIGPSPEPPPAVVPLERLRDAIRRQRKLAIVYRDAAGAQSARVVWPIALAYPDGVRLLVTWCETRAGFRTFRVDRIVEGAVAEERYPRSRRALLKDWRAQLD